MATKKTAKKKVATKKAARPAPPVPGMVKILVGDEEMKQSEFFALRAKEHDLEPKQVKDMFMAAASGVDSIEEDPDLSPEKNESIQAAFSQLTEDWEAHQAAAEAKKEAKEKEKAAKEAEKEEKKKLKEKRSKALTTALAKTTVAKPVTGLIGDSFKTVLGAKFTVTPGGIKLKKGAKVSDSEIANILGDFQALIDTTEAAKNQVALREAQFVAAIRTQVGDEWINFFSDRLADVARIKKYLRIVDTVKPTLLAKIPLNNIRAVVESKYDKDDKDANAERKEKALKALEEEFETEGKVTQLKAREIRDKFMKEDKEKFKAPNLIYLVINAEGNPVFVGAHSRDALLAKGSVACIDRKAGVCYPIDADGDYLDPYNICGPTPKILSYIKSMDDTLDEDEDETTDDVEEEEVEEEVEEVEETEEGEEEEEEWEEEETEEEEVEEEEEDDWED